MVMHSFFATNYHHGVQFHIPIHCLHARHSASHPTSHHLDHVHVQFSFIIIAFLTTYLHRLPKGFQYMHISGMTLNPL